MKKAKKFRFDPEQVKSISNSFNDFKNDAIKEIAADSAVGGTTFIKVITFRRVIIVVRP